MKVEPVVAVKGNCKKGTFLGGLIDLAAMVTLLLIPMAALSGVSSGPVKKSDAVKFEDIPGSTIKRVILTAKAAERLGIEIGKVREEPILRTQMVGGRIVLPPEKKLALRSAGGGFGDFRNLGHEKASRPLEESAKQPAADKAWVVVTLSRGEWDRLQKDKPARVLPLETRNMSGMEVMAQPSEIPPYQDAKRTVLKLYYMLPEEDHGLTMYHRVRVELPLKGSEEKRKVVPYSAVYYDAKGTAWLYVNPQPLIFERQRVEIERIAGDLAILSDGPPVGTQVVTVGSALLYGSEVFFKK